MQDPKMQDAEIQDMSALKRQLDQQISRLPADQLREVLDFARGLLQKEERHQAEPAQSPLSPEQGPLLDLIGSIDEAPFTHDIDEELYGSQPVPDPALEDVRKRLAKIKGSMSKTIRSMRDERG